METEDQKRREYENFEVDKGLKELFIGGANAVAKRQTFYDNLVKLCVDFQFEYKYGLSADDKNVNEKSKLEPLLYRMCRESPHNLAFAIAHFYPEKVQEALTRQNIKANWTTNNLPDLTIEQFGTLLSVMGTTRKEELSIETATVILNLFKRHYNVYKVFDRECLTAVQNDIKAMTSLDSNELRFMQCTADMYFKWSNDTENYYRIRKRCAWAEHEAHVFAKKRQCKRLELYGPLITMIKDLNLSAVPSSLYKMPIEAFKRYTRYGDPTIDADLSELSRDVSNLFGARANRRNNSAILASLFTYIRKVHEVLFTKNSKYKTNVSEIVHICRLEVGSSMVEYIKSTDSQVKTVQTLKKRRSLYKEKKGSPKRARVNYDQSNVVHMITDDSEETPRKSRAVNESEKKCIDLYPMPKITAFSAVAENW